MDADLTERGTSMRVWIFRPSVLAAALFAGMTTCAATAAEAAARRADLPPVTKDDFRARVTGVAVVENSRRYGSKSDVEFAAPETPLEVPYGKTALFRVEYDFPEGYGAHVWVSDSLCDDGKAHSGYFGSNPSGLYKGKGTAYGFLVLLGQGKACRLKSVEVRTNSNPQLENRPNSWEIAAASVDLDFKEKPADWESQQDAKRPPVSKYVPVGWTEDFEAARRQAASEGKFVLAAFSGSDWCGPCMALEREVFSQKAFLDAVAAKYVPVMLSFPHDKSTLSKLAVSQNGELKKRYPIQGYPTVIVVDPVTGEVVKRRTGYRAGGAGEYLTSLDALMKEVERPAKGRQVKSLPTSPRQQQN